MIDNNDTWSGIFRILWDFIHDVMYFTTDLWLWLTTPQTISLVPESKGFLSTVIANIFTGVNDYVSFTFVPLHVFASGVIIVLLTLYLIKTFIPLT